MLIYARSADEQGFVDNGEKSVDLSTWKMLKTLVFHKVIHIVHNFRGKTLGKKEEHLCFLWKSEKPEKPPFFLLRKNFGNG